MLVNSFRSSPFDLEYTDKEIKPFWTIEDWGNEDEVLKRCNANVDACQQYYAPHFCTQRDNLLLYQGIHWLQMDKYSNRPLDSNTRINTPAKRPPRVVINHLYDIPEQRVSRLTRYRPAVAIYPATPDSRDKDNARISQDVLDYMWYDNTIDKHLQQFVKNMSIFGEGYLSIKWNPNKGDLHPDWVKAQQEGRRIPATDSQGAPILSEDGTPLYIDKAIRVGDVEYEATVPWRIMEMPCRSRDKIEWDIEWDTVDTEYLKAKYPDKADKIGKDDGPDVFSHYGFNIGKQTNETVVYQLHHKGTEFLDKGRYIKWVRGAVLENTDNPYGHRGIPRLWLPDIEVPDCTRGMSVFQQVYPIQHQINAVASLIYKAFVLFCHPKIAAPEGSVDINQLLNESTALFYSGGVPPNMLNNSPVPPELFGWMDKLESLFEKLSGNFALSRGEAPSGIRAAKALRVLEEQEDKRAFGLATRYNQVALVDNARMSLSTMGTFADEEDGRLARIVGKDNEFKIRPFKAANLARPFDIRIENTTALSRSPSGRIEDIIELAQVEVSPTSPVSKGQMQDILNLTADEQFKDISTRAARCAESENDDMLAGVTVAPPTPNEDLITHWKTHLQPCQSRDYKENLPEDRKKLFDKHTWTTEVHMYMKAYGITDPMTGMPIQMPNMAFQQRLMMECPDWPVYFKMPTPGMPPMGAGMGGGMMPPGAPVGPEAGGVQQAPIDTGVPPEMGAPVGPPAMPPMPPMQ